MKTITCEFYCNAGETTETVSFQVDETENIENQIEAEFHLWLDNNEDCGYEVLSGADI